MRFFKLLPIPEDDYEALGIKAHSTLQTYINNEDALVIRVLDEEDMADFICNGKCEYCPLYDVDCDHECLACPCYAVCEYSDYNEEENKDA